MKELPPFYQRYVDKVPDLPLEEALDKGKTKLFELFHSISDEQLNFSYAEDKWSLRQLLMHLIDSERIFAYRAARFCRGDKTPLAGFDENEYASNAQVAHLSKKFLLQMYEINRLNTVYLFRSLSDEELQKSGSSNGLVMKVETLGKLICGHERHHLEVINERYIPVLTST